MEPPKRNQATLVLRCSLSALAILLGGCDSFDREEGSGRLLLEVAPISERLAADGVSSFIVTSRVYDWCEDDGGKGDCELATGKVTFTASGGTFLRSGDKTVEISLKDGTAEVRLRATSPGEVLVSAAIGPLREEVSVEFGPAYPTEVLVDPGAFSLAADSTNQATTVTVRLRRDSGAVTAGQRVEFSAPHGQFRGRGVAYSDADGTATAVFSAGGTEFRGELPIAATVETTSGPITGTATLTITGPPPG